MRIEGKNKGSKKLRRFIAESLIALRRTRTWKSAAMTFWMISREI
jgi:hypothetical protein